MQRKVRERPHYQLAGFSSREEVLKSFDAAQQLLSSSAHVLLTGRRGLQSLKAKRA
jgi:hypothetical protein